MGAHTCVSLAYFLTADQSLYVLFKHEFLYILRFRYMATLHFLAVISQILSKFTFPGE